MAKVQNIMFNLHKVVDEDTTLDILLSGRSISRIGEGELRLVTGTGIKSQKYDSKLAYEMRQIMGEKSDAYVCLPRLWPEMPNYGFWLKFNRAEYAKHYRLKEYGSAFITRPDMANHIDRQNYWKRISTVWTDHAVTLVSHGMVLKMPEASNVKLIKAPAINAYSDIDKIEEEIGKPSGPIMLCLGATATVLAARLSSKNLWALDLGHLPHFFPHAGAYSVDKSTLISDEYINQNKVLHARPEGYGGSGKKSAETVKAFAATIGAARILDYGCGQGTLKNKLRDLGCQSEVLEYDPAIPGKDLMPKPADLVCCTDVLEHIEPDKLGAVLQHIYTLTKHSAYLLIAMRAANKTLPDGRNAHLTVKDARWWREKVSSVGFHINKEESKVGHEVKFWCSKNG